MLQRESRGAAVGPSAFVGLLLALVAASAAVVARFWRGLAYAVLQAAALIYDLSAQSALAFLIVPLLALAAGLVTLLRFLRAHPRPAAR
ncbi:MAG: hypothetical protein M1389_12475 [Chloroflexi bacterium]|nr:hypothetical protein [Chloroflexota bacterium]